MCTCVYTREFFTRTPLWVYARTHPHTLRALPHICAQQIPIEPNSFTNVRILLRPPICLGTAIYASPSMADKFVDDIFKSDTNADGEISLKEFKHWLENSKSEMAAGLQDMFEDASEAAPPAAASAH
jgi:hypothetical protein